MVGHPFGVVQAAMVILTGHVIALGEQWHVMKWTQRDIIRTGAAILATLVGWVVLRLIFPVFDYYPPQILVENLERSWFVTSGYRKLTMAVYAAVALVMLAVFFKAIQERWPGRGHLKGLAFGASLGVIWTFAFFSNWAFLGTTLQAEFLNSTNDLIGLSVGGWLIGWAVGRDSPKSDVGIWSPLLAVLLIAVGFVVVFALGAHFLADLGLPASEMLLVPKTPVQFALLFGLGLWAGGMFTVVHPGLPFNSTSARAAFFAFGIFGHSWTWFHCFNLIEFAGVTTAILLMGLTGAAGVFAGVLAYEGFAARKQKVG